MKLLPKLLIGAIIGIGAVYAVLKVSEYRRGFDIAAFIQDSGFEAPKEARVISPDDYERNYNIKAGTDLLLINFWATWCAPCVKELQEFDELAARYPSERFKIIAFGVGETRESIETFLKEKKISGKNIYFVPDENNKMSESFHVEYLPVTLAANREGKIITGVLGIRPWLREDYAVFMEYLMDKQTL